MSAEECRLIGITGDGDRATEKEIHNRFSSVRVRGEWFQATSQVLEWVHSNMDSPNNYLNLIEKQKEELWQERMKKRKEKKPLSRPVKRKRGRPRKEVKEINPVRQVGRWTDADWQEVRDAAEAKGVNVAAFVKRIVKRAVKRLAKQ